MNGLNRFRTESEQAYIEADIRITQYLFIMCLIRRLAKILVRCKNETGKQ